MMYSPCRFIKFSTLPPFYRRPKTQQPSHLCRALTPSYLHRRLLGPFPSIAVPSSSFTPCLTSGRHLYVMQPCNLLVPNAILLRAATAICEAIVNDDKGTAPTWMLVSFCFRDRLSLFVALFSPIDNLKRTVLGPKSSKFISAPSTRFFLGIAPEL